jgi:hypothetical protein
VSTVYSESGTLLEMETRILLIAARVLLLLGC